jgi:N6-adenosine-specific RNA methylase IME4
MVLAEAIYLAELSPTYGCISIDPPWLERGGGKSKRGADRHYPLMKWQDTLRVVLQESPFNPAESCHLWVWVTDNFLQDGIKLIDALGFRYIRMMPWVKQKGGKLQTGLGQYMRGAHEVCLFAVKGPAILPPTKDRPPSVLKASRTKHSEKPSAAHRRMEKVSPGPYLELFARTPRDGWTVWGNEIEDG